ncbi:MAG: nucleoid-associated protein [Thomasclavelia sp.]|nr:nucleoid-associated protein [Thomasclavelia sp.]
MNTIIKDKILIHMLDMEHSRVILSDTFVDLETSDLEYYDKKIEKTLQSSSIKELVVGSEHHLLLAAKKMLESDEEFINQAAKIANELFMVVKNVEEMPNSNLMFVECKVDGVKHILILKLNYKLTPVSVMEEDEDGKRSIRFTIKQLLPSKGLNVDEAIIINTDDNKISYIEKRVMIDGKPGYYLNEQYIKGENKKSDKEKMNAINKVVKRLDSAYNAVDGEPVPAIKKEIVDCIVEHKPIKPVDVVKKIVSKDIQAVEEVEENMADIGITSEDEIINLPVSLDRMSRCKLVLDDDKVIELNTEDYLNNDDVIKETGIDGTTTITLKNIHEIKIK